MLTHTLRTAEMSAEIDRIVRATGKEAIDVVLEEGRLLADDLVRLTPPFGSAPSTESFNAQRKVGENAVERDIRRTFAVLDVTKIRDRRVRKDLEAAARKRDLTAIKRILQYCKIPVNQVLTEPDPAVHAAARDRRGRVQRFKKIWVIKDRSVNRFIRQVKEHVGKAKAGWAAGAEKLGVKLPAWIKRHGTGGGNIDIKRDPRAPQITLRNTVSYIQAAGGDLRIVERAMKNRTRNMRAKLERIARSGWKKKG